MTTYIKFGCAIVMLAGAAAKGGEVGVAYLCFGVYVIGDALKELARREP